MALSSWTSAAQADLTGKWRMQVRLGSPPSYTEFVDVTQVGTTVTFSFFGWSFTGSSSAPLFEADAPAQGPWGPAHLRGILPADETLLPAAIATSLGPQGGQLAFFAERCGCFDGNATDGDGCSAECQVEECYTCSGAPSVCTPASDGTPCEDGLVCTGGETCTGGSCGGSSPIVPCIDLSGYWLLHTNVVEFQMEGDGIGYYRQTPGFLMQSSSPTASVEFAGPIDPATGAYQLTGLFWPDQFAPFLCTDPYGGFSGQSTDGVTLTATGFTFITSPTQCYQVTLEVNGSRCGGGTLDAGEQCDDGNGTAGDGCDASCNVEPCYVCVGEPSVCSPDDGAPCDDGNGCTTSDACSGGSCVGTPDNGAPCEDGDACTTGDACQGGSCASGAPVVCETCLACAPDGVCEPAPRADCHESTNPERNLLVLRRRGTDTVTWKWVRGAATSLQDLGNPVVDDDYAMCVYDESGPTPQLLFRATAPAGGTCGSGPCWEPISDRGFSYDDDAATPDGLNTIDLKSGEDGRAKAIVKGQGPMLSNRPYGFPVPPLPLPLRAQLQSENAGCFESYFTGAGVVDNDPGGRRFKGRGSASP